MKINVKKVLTIVTLACVAVFTALSILAITDVLPLEDAVSQVYFSVIILGLTCLVLITPVSLLKNNFPLALSNIIFTSCSCGMFLIVCWSNESADTAFWQVALTITLFAILFTMACSNIIKLKNTYIWIQIPVYCLIAFCDVILSLLIFDAIAFEGTLMTLFFIAAILCAAGLVSLAVIAKKDLQVEKVSDDNVVISKAEYEQMQREIAELQEEVSQLKNTIVCINKIKDEQEE